MEATDFNWVLLSPVSTRNSWLVIWQVSVKSDILCELLQGWRAAVSPSNISAPGMIKQQGLPKLSVLSMERIAHSWSLKGGQLVQQGQN